MLYHNRRGHNYYCKTVFIQEEKNLELRKEGVGVVLDSTLPHLIAVDDDILSTGITLFHLKVCTDFHEKKIV